MKKDRWNLAKVPFTDLYYRSVLYIWARVVLASARSQNVSLTTHSSLRAPAMDDAALLYQKIRTYRRVLEFHHNLYTASNRI